MRLFTTREDDGFRLGMVLAGDRHIDVAGAGAALGIAVPATPQAFFEAGEGALPTLRSLAAAAEAAREDAAWRLPQDGLPFGPCVPDPGKILCVGLNYARHARESGMELPTSPVLFSKFNNAVAAPGQAIALPPVTERVDYEAELVAVIGRRAHEVPEAQALDHVLGYCNGNDLSARDLQMRTGQWLLGKTLDGFFPIGPYLVTRDEVADPQALRIRSWLNGEPRQDSSTADMVFTVAQIVSYASRHMTLEPGDVIATGTPEGVILGMSEKVWMRPGDVSTVEVEGLGRLENRMVAPAGG
jgi:2-keto-4-pentenoate hydratase/2-oxohepta-3-ene-1,7-dioic acid hydratase in catechol pathway